MSPAREPLMIDRPLSRENPSQSRDAILRHLAVQVKGFIRSRGRTTQMSRAGSVSPRDISVPEEQGL